MTYRTRTKYLSVIEERDKLRAENEALKNERNQATSEQLIAEVERLCGTLKVIAAWAATSASYHRSDSVIEREFTDIEEGIEDAVARIDKLLQPLRAVRRLELEVERLKSELREDWP